MAALTPQDKVPMVIRPGISFNRTIVLKDNNGNPINLTGFSYFCEVRTKPGGDLLATMSAVVTAAQGRVDFSLSLDNTKKIGFNGGVYDVIEQKDSDPQANTSFLFGGTVQILPSVTQVLS